MSDLNQVAVSGRLTRDVELKYLASGTPVASFSIANNRDRKVNEEWVEEVSYFDCEQYGARAETVARKLAKGSFVTVAGKMEQQRWEVQVDGEAKTRSKVVLIAQHVEGQDFYKPKAEDNAIGDAAAADAPATQGSQAPGSDDDIPF
jgi:single-strand DNA-binding protein